MKENPIDSKVRQDMQERDLGSDTRLIAQIIESDEAELRAAGLGADELARAMRRLTEKGMESLGDEVQADGLVGNANLAWARRCGLVVTVFQHFAAAVLAELNALGHLGFLIGLEPLHAAKGSIQSS